MHQCIQGLMKRPTVAPGAVTWWARAEPLASLQKVYHLGDEVIFCSFTHSTLDFKLACSMAGYNRGTILEFTLLEGFRLGSVSGKHDDVVLPPNKRFVVTFAPMRRLTGVPGEDGPPQNKNGKIPRKSNQQGLVSIIKMQQLTDGPAIS